MANHRMTVKFGIRLVVENGRWNAEVAWIAGTAAYPELTAAAIMTAAGVIASNLTAAIAGIVVAPHGKTKVGLNFEVWREAAPDTWISECEDIPTAVSASQKPLEALYDVAKQVVARVADVIPKPRKRAA